MKIRIVNCFMMVLVILSIAAFSGCVDEAGTASEEDNTIIEEEVASSEDQSSETLVEAPAGISVNETKVLGDRIVIVLENSGDEKVHLARIGADISYEENSNAVEYFETQMDAYLEPGTTKPIVIRIRKLSDWQSARVRKVVVSSMGSK